MWLHVCMNLLLLWITYVNGYPCTEGCARCGFSNMCEKCELGYFLTATYLTAKCFKCPLTCKTCSRIDSCLSCKPTFYGTRCEQSCSLCKNDECTQYGCVIGCKSGYFFKSNVCKKCSYMCTECTRQDICSICKNGRWGDRCRFSCIPCSQCVSKSCRNKCIVVQGYRCANANSRCPEKCSCDFSDPIQTVSSTLQTPTTSKTLQLTTRLPTPLTTRSTTTRTTRSTPTRRGTQITTQPSQPQPSTRATSITDGPETPTLYILIAVIGVLVLMMTIMVVVFIKKRKRTSRQDHVSSSPDTQAESHQLADNAGVYCYASNHGNAFGNLATNVAESDTGYDNINTVNNVATINVAESNTGFFDLNSRMYENVDDKTAMNALDTVNAYKAINQYTNVRGAENTITSTTGNKTFYYNVLD